MNSTLFVLQQGSFTASTDTRFRWFQLKAEWAADGGHCVHQQPGKIFDDPLPWGQMQQHGGQTWFSSALPHSGF